MIEPPAVLSVDELIIVKVSRWIEKTLPRVELMRVDGPWGVVVKQEKEDLAVLMSLAWVHEKMRKPLEENPGLGSGE